MGNPEETSAPAPEDMVCGTWVRRNADVLADTHWVGGNPWDKVKKDGDIYGWAAWNSSKCTLTLRNSSGKPKALNTTLRKVFDIPAEVKGAIVLRSSFADQRALPGICDVAVDVAPPLSISMEPMEIGSVSNLLVKTGKIEHS